MDELTLLDRALDFFDSNALLSSTVVSVVVGFVTTGFISYQRRPKKISQGGSYFNDEDLLKPPMARPAYSDRMSYVLAEMSALAYFEFEGAAGVLDETVENFLKINADVKSDSELQVRALLKKFRDESLVKTIDSEKFLKGILKEADFVLLETINIKNTQAIVCKRVKSGELPYIVVAYRGTEMNIDDWLTDINAEPADDTEPGIKVHKGFWEALNKNKDGDDKTVLDRVQDRLDSKEARDGKKRLPCFFTGHSLGGALALITSREKALDINGACYTFGAPRVANYDYFQNMKTPVFRVVNSSDIVPRVPPGAPMGIFLKIIQGLGWLTKFIPVAREPLKWLEERVDKLNGYRHHGDLRYLTDVKGGLYKDVHLVSNPPMIDRVWWMWQHIRESFFAPVKSHGMAIYRNKLLYLAVSRNLKLGQDAPSPAMEDDAAATQAGA
jgi:triacylglycerol lipase